MVPPDDHTAQLDPPEVAETADRRGDEAAGAGDGSEAAGRPAAASGRAVESTETRVSNLTTTPTVDGVLELEPTSRAHKIGTLAVVTIPFAAFLAAVVLLWEKWINVHDVALMAVTHVIAAFGITVGFHRLLTHRSFETKPWVRGILTAAGSLAIEGRPTHWVADHRRHHAYSDEEGDPHSPHVGRGSGFWQACKGAWHAHVGWMFADGQTPVKRFAPDLLKDRVVMAVDRRFPWFIVLAVAGPALIGFAVTGTALGAVAGAFWGGLVRIFITHHITWSVNSICHMFGRRPFATDDRSTNNWLLALPTMGEGWHHNHHAFPTSAFHGLRGWQKAMDPSGWVVLALEKTGLAWNVKRVSAEQMAAKAR